MKLGLVIPCRNEALVIERKLANLARLRWPAAELSVVVVDDGSEDGTAERARAAASRHLPGRELRVVENRERAGKPGALRSGLAALGAGIELVVLSDADVLLEPQALGELARAFEREPELGMACGAQRFVRELPADGAYPADAPDACAPWDRWTARVRRLESRAGALFSVHGQLLAWRAGLGLEPRLGLAADDLDLMLQVRSRTDGPRRVRLVSSALFAEEKTPPGRRAEEQALRRARAYLQLVRAHRAPLGGLLGSLQWLFYRWGPVSAPALTWILFALVAVGGPFVCAGAWRALPPLGAGLALLTGPGRRWIGLMGRIARAGTLEREATLTERWEMARS